MILYIADEEHDEPLHYLNEDIHTMKFNNQDMRQVFRQELQKISAVTHVIVEDGAVDMKTWGAAAEAFRCSQKIPLLLLIDDINVPDTYIRGENYDTLNRGHKDIHDALSVWVQKTMQGDTELAALNHVWIAVAGLTQGCGATSLAMHLAAHIHRQKQEVAVTERANAFTSLSAAYDWQEIAEGSYQWGGVIYHHNQIDENSPFTIFDLGIMNHKCLAIWKQCQIKILVVDGKPYHMQNLGEQIRQLRDYPGTVILAFTFVPEAEKPNIRKRYTSEKVRVWFVPFEPDLFLSSDEYQELVNDYVTPVQEEKKKKTIIPFRMPKPIPNKKMIGVILLTCIASVSVGAIIGTAGNQKRDTIQVAVESVPKMDFTAITRIRMILVEEQAERMTEEVVADNPEEVSTEVVTETETEEEKKVDKSSQSVIPVTEEDTQLPVPEVSTEEPQQTQEVPASLIPSLSGYNGQIYTGSDVMAIMNQFSGQNVAMHLITRSSDGWYNYTISNGSMVPAGAVSDGTALIDTQCSFLCQVIQVNGEDVGLEFIQQ